MGPLVATRHDADVNANALMTAVESFRIEGFQKLHAERRSEFGQFATPSSISSFMASMFEERRSPVRLLDAGAGVGSLAAAYVADICGRRVKPAVLSVTAFEIEPRLAVHLAKTLELCGRECQQAGISFRGTLRQEDFIEAAVGMLQPALFGHSGDRFDCAILNPPYRKLNADSAHRHLLRQVGVETSNLYTAFLSLATMLLEPGGELVAITPRSFCNGTYFRPFREFFLRRMSLRRIHMFESRREAFADDDVLQENIVFHAVKTPSRTGAVVISVSGAPGETPKVRRILQDKLVKPDDPDKFIHIVPDEAGARVADLMSSLDHSLEDIGLAVSTGRVVDFRCRQHLRANPAADTVPLIYPGHFSHGWIAWPRPGHKKPNAYAVTEASEKWLVPAAVHVLVRRFSAKEEKRRIVAAMFDPAKVPCQSVAFENHVNYFHDDGAGLTITLAKGLVAYLNSTIVDAYFRQFNGHTQVNATDLRNLRYPSRNTLERLGATIGDVFPQQEELDALVERKLFGHGKEP